MAECVLAQARSFVGEATRLNTLFADFEQFATRLLAEHGHRAVLVFDNIDVIAKEDPKLLYTLQSLAKEAADNGPYKMVFVCSDGPALAQMMAGSAWSRGHYDFECDI
ncbi:hypothetical protein BZA05DRAFT_449381 [Tricharina praecox]|uniref:uncharacterized protein n=1 Tax=Tricharina praecox TaxID=43433 RepID=UPI002220AC77|nr:uncharacterized protein BZA05DRAFT_449381 [Tricharina praecox]KAI5842016.1 hypothetical protein BZA05DRAFT_449381 [Tricharina praecox]